ncbi:hypothetical protein ADUPG1_008406 [Aduncisulcus paluster]|uniref:EGF-like domain-containing protein n=1 Tax=Aduncisulcus paluster TaxID=2918883 RepID=A0ABQ5KUU3_9EUKA|nr:hypothetical protein ADUPG1_008406 [Aduncisulcus paluster]
MCSNYSCDTESHTCLCESSLSGDYCEFEIGITLSSLGMDTNLIKLVCEIFYNLSSSSSTCSDESVLSSLTVDDLSTITSLTIPNTVSSLSGLEYAEHLEILSFEPGNTLISDLSPIASLSSLYVLELDSLENMDVSLLSTLTDAVGALKMDLESDTSRWNGTSESYCVGLCSLRSLEISGSDDSIGSDLSSFTSLLNNIAMCSGQCVSSYDDGTKVYPLSSTLIHLDLSSNAISDPTVVSLQPGLSGVTHLTLSDNSISDLALLQQVVDDSNSTIAYVDVSDNRLDCGSTVSECLNSLADICERDISGSGDGNDGVEVVFGDVDGSSGDVSQDTTSPCGSKPISISSIFCSYSQDHLVCQVNDSADDDGSEYVCVCGSGYYEDTSSGECVSVSSSSSSACSNCGGERGTCVYDADSDSSDESLPFCECSDGWYGTDCSSICPVSDDLGLCSGSSRGTCDAATHICVCESGYYGSACQLSCSDDDSCGGNGTCSVGSFLDPSSSDPSSVSSEAIVCECSSGWYGSSCFSTIPTDVFVSSDGEAEDYPCGRDYSYSDSSDPTTASYSAYANESSSTCECAPHGLALSSSSGTCIDPATHPDYRDILGNDTACSECGTSASSHGVCELNEETMIASCSCEHGWNDSYCDANICPISSDGVLCGGHGECHTTTGECECVVDTSDKDGANPQYIWYGDACTHECPTHPSSDVLCSGLGVCNPLTHSCLCAWGFSGDACQWNMCAIGYGEYGHDSECFDHGSCVAGDSSKNEPPFYCSCKVGWGGMFCERDICLCDPESSYGCATINDGSRACKCKEGWYGRACERRYSGSQRPYSFF